MAARWVGLSRPRKKITTTRPLARRGIGHTIHEFLHALGAVGFLVFGGVFS